MKDLQIKDKGWGIRSDVKCSAILHKLASQDFH